MRAHLRLCLHLRGWASSRARSVRGRRRAAAMRMRPTRPPPTVARRCPSRASRSRRSCCGGTRLAPRSSRPAGRAQPRHAPPCGSPAVAQAARRPSKRGPGARRRCPHPVAPSQPTAERTVIFEHLRVACLNFVQVADDRREYSPDIHPPVPCIMSARLSCSVYRFPVVRSNPLAPCLSRAARAAAPSLPPGPSPRLGHLQPSRLLCRLLMHRDLLRRLRSARRWEHWHRRTRCSGGRFRKCAIASQSS